MAFPSRPFDDFESIRRWWRRLGKARYPDTARLLITADCGGSNGARVHLWKSELQRFANQTGLAVTVVHLPPGTSKWNRIEHRLFAYITQNWRGKPLVSYKVIIQLIAATSTGKDSPLPAASIAHAIHADQNIQSRIGRHQHRASLFPRRVELHNQTKQ